MIENEEQPFFVTKKTTINIYTVRPLLLFHGKKDKLRTLIRRAFTPFSNDNVLKKESHHIERCLTEINDFKPPYKGNHGISLIRSIKTSAKKTLPEKHDFRIMLKSTKLSSQFYNKDGTNKQHKHDLDMILVVVRPRLELRALWEKQLGI